MENKIDMANKEAITRIQKSIVYLEGVSTAGKEIEALKNGKASLHSGPPLEYKDMCSAMKQSIYGAAVYEGWAENLEKAKELADSGAIKFYSCNENNAVGPMSGVVTPSMPMYVFKNHTFGNYSRVTLNEGLGKTLRFGGNDESVIKRLNWMEKVLGPILNKAVELSGPINLSEILEQGLRSGDEAHNRNKACTGLFIRKIAPFLVRTDASREDIADVLKFLDSNDHTFLNLSMGVSKATMDNIIGIENSTIVSCMCTNGHEFGLRVAGTGKKWFTSPSPFALGNYFAGRSKEDASPTIGDSYISEAAGIGAFAMGCAPGIGQFIGITVEEGIEYSSRMYKITVSEHERFNIPALNYRGTPLGIDIRKVLETGILPIINTGIAHKLPGVGQIGAGIVYPPMECFEKAIKEFRK